MFLWKLFNTNYVIPTFANYLTPTMLYRLCYIGYVMSTFANVNLSTHFTSNKLKNRIAKIIMENEFQCKHKEKKRKERNITTG